MLEQDRDPVIAICLLAALADGERTAEEQGQFAKIAAKLGGSDLPELIARMQSGTVTAVDAARKLSSPDARQLAYEMAVSVVYADGDANPRESAFLADLHQVLEIEGEAPEATRQEVAKLAQAPLTGPTMNLMPSLARVPPHSQAGIPAMSHEEALDEMIRRQALLTGALELLPQNLASMAIIPLQMRLVYRIGADFGHKLDGPQIKDLLGAMGIGAAAQVLDGMARRILGGLGRGLLGSVLGGIVGGTAGVAAGAGVSFVTTYALGHAAKQYYAQGRKLSPADLRALFERFRGEAEGLLPRVQQEIHAQAQHLDLKRVMSAIQGG